MSERLYSEHDWLIDLQNKSIDYEVEQYYQQQQITETINQIIEEKMGKPNVPEELLDVPETPKVFSKAEVLDILVGIDRELNPDQYGNVASTPNFTISLDKAHELGIGEEFETLRKINGYVTIITPPQDNVTGE